MIHYAILGVYMLLVLAYMLLWQATDELSHEIAIRAKEREAESVRQALELDAWVRTLPIYARRQAF